MYNKAENMRRMVVIAEDEITELLRNRTQMDYAPLVAEIKALQDRLIELCSD